MKRMALTAVLLVAAGPVCAGSAFEKLLQEAGGQEVAPEVVGVPAGSRRAPPGIYSSESYRSNLPDCYPGHRYGMDADGVCLLETRRTEFFNPGSCAKRETRRVEPGDCKFERIARQVKVDAGSCRFSATRDVRYTMSYGLGFCESIGTCQAKAVIVGASSGVGVAEHEVHIVDEDCRCYKVAAKRRRTIFTNPFNGPIWSKETRVDTLDLEACAALMETEAHKDAVKRAYQGVEPGF